MSSLSIGIVGLPNVGKSTLFNALTKSSVLAANYPFATIEPNTGIVAVPDPRLAKLATLYENPKIKPATVTFVDIAGIVRGAHEGEGLGNQFLGNIRSVNAIAHVVRAFKDPDVQHVDGTHDTLRDIETIKAELALADIQSIDKQLPKLEKEARNDPKKMVHVNALKTARAILDEGDYLYESHDREAIAEHLVSFHLLTFKPMVYVFNVDEEDLENEALHKELSIIAGKSEFTIVSAKLESELIGLDESEARELLETYGQSESGLAKLAQAAYSALGLQSYLTAGPKEVRAWTIRAGSSAPQAAGVIHGDFERGFIAADVVNFDDLMSAKTWPEARKLGKVRLEGKTYIMRPDDVVEFKFNV